MINIATSIAIDDTNQPPAHYPQIPFLRSKDRRLTYWKCACVFFKTSVHANHHARHLLITNDSNPPIIEGLDSGAFLAGLGVEILTVPFEEFRPVDAHSKIFRNNFYKLTALAYAVRHYTGCIYLFDSDVIWLKRWEAPLAGLSLYQAFVRSPEQRDPTGVSADDLSAMYALLDGNDERRHVDWCGGEFIGGDQESLTAFMSRLKGIFSHWQTVFSPSLHQFSNGVSIFDNDEFVISRTAIDFDTSFTNQLRRVWTGPDGGGDSSCLECAALHLPNEKLQGIAGLFDYLVLDREDICMDVLAGYCGVPKRRFHYRPRSRWANARLKMVDLVKSLLPSELYIHLRSLFGRGPI